MRKMHLNCPKTRIDPNFKLTFSLQMLTAKMLRIILFSFISCAFSFRLGSRVDYAQYLNQSKTNHFVPYERGFVGYYGDAKNYQRERINEGSPFTAAHPKLWDSVNQARA